MIDVETIGFSLEPFGKRTAIYDATGKGLATVDDLYKCAARLGAIVVTVPDLQSCVGALGQAHTPRHCVFTSPTYDYLNPAEKFNLYRHIRAGGSVIMLDREATNDQSTLAHELGHVAAYLADLDLDERRLSRALWLAAVGCRMGRSHPEALQNRDELLAECIAWRILGKPLPPRLKAFSEIAFEPVRMAVQQIHQSADFKMHRA